MSSLFLKLKKNWHTFFLFAFELLTFTVLLLKLMMHFDLSLMICQIIETIN